MGKLVVVTAVTLLLSLGWHSSLGRLEEQSPMLYEEADISLSDTWHVLGPFQAGTRGQQFLLSVFRGP